MGSRLDYSTDADTHKLNRHFSLFLLQTLVGVAIGHSATLPANDIRAWRREGCNPFTTERWRTSTHPRDVQPLPRVTRTSQDTEVVFTSGDGH